MAQAPATKQAGPNYIQKPTPLDVKVQEVRTILVEYHDESNRPTIQLAIVGKNNVQLLNGQQLGLSTGSQRSGIASREMRNAIFTALGIAIPKEEEK